MHSFMKQNAIDELVKRLENYFSDKGSGELEIMHWNPLVRKLLYDKADELGLTHTTVTHHDIHPTKYQQDLTDASSWRWTVEARNVYKTVKFVKK